MAIIELKVVNMVINNGVHDGCSYNLDVCWVSLKINGLRLVPPLGNLLLLGHVCSACVVTIGIKKGKTKGTNGFNNRGNKILIEYV